MEKEQQESYRPVIHARLREIESEIAGTADDTKAIAPDNAIGRLSRLDSMQMQQMALAARQRLSDERLRLNEALRRIDEGMFGRCLLCTEDIAAERLQLQPDAVTCVPCSRRKK